MEKEQTDLIKEATLVLYGKLGIRVYPPRPGLEMHSDEFLIPYFIEGTKKDWASIHFVLAMTEFSWCSLLQSELAAL